MQAFSTLWESGGGGGDIVQFTSSNFFTMNYYNDLTHKCTHMPNYRKFGSRLDSH